MPNIHLEVNDKQEGLSKTIFIIFCTEIHASIFACVDYLISGLMNAKLQMK